MPSLHPMRLAALVALLTATACAPPEQFDNAPVAQEPVIVAEPSVRTVTENCDPSGDGIGGTGCPHY